MNMDSASKKGDSCRYCLQTITSITDTVWLHPCRCVVCKDCWIDHLAKTLTKMRMAKLPSSSTAALVECRACTSEVESHHYRKNHVVGNDETVDFCYSTQQEQQQQHRPAKRKRGQSRKNSSIPQTKNDTTTEAKAATTTTITETKETESTSTTTPLLHKRKRGRPKKSTSPSPPKISVKPHTPFAQRVADLRSFKAQYGHTRVPSQFSDNKGLADWVKNVRRGALTINKERLRILNDIGFAWEPDKNIKARLWAEMFDKLKSYKEEHGNVRVKIGVNKVLYAWVNTQRQLKNKGLLKEERMEMLNGLGMIWSTPKAQLISCKKVEDGEAAGIAGNEHHHGNDADGPGVGDIEDESSSNDINQSSRIDIDS